MVSLEVARMAGGLVVVATGKDGATEGILWGNVDMSFVSQDMVVELPVREVRLKGGGDVLQGHL